MKIDEQCGNAEPCMRDKKRRHVPAGGEGDDTCGHGFVQKKTADGKNLLRVKLESESND